MARAGRKVGTVLLALAGLGLLVLVAAVVVAVVLSRPEKGVVLELELKGTMPQGPVADPLADLGLAPRSPSLWDVERALRYAATDENVAALLVTIDGPELGPGQARELVDELRLFAASGKPVHTFLRTDMVEDGACYLASGGSRVWAAPVAMWLVNGLGADVTFWRGTLDKLHVEPECVMFREYKSAGEPYCQTEMSEAFRESIDDVLGDVQAAWFADVALRRGLDEAAVRALVDRGTLSPQQALDGGLVDQLGYLSDVQEALRLVAGTDEYQGLDLGKYLGRVEDEGGSVVALVFGEGPVVAGESASPFATAQRLEGPVVAEHIRDATKDEQVKAIVFRVDSPGGSAVGSDMVWKAIEEAQAKGKPVVVSMSTVAGSGGYWVAMGADAIVAQPTTITGSIGLVLVKYNVRGFMEWIGARVESVEYAERADMLGAYSSLSEAERADLLADLEQFYEGFVAKVAEGRHLDPAAVEAIAKGRIWTGADAKDKGLVDELGGLHTALDLAAGKAGLDAADLRVVVYPPPKPFLEQVLEGDLAAAVRGPTLDAASVRAGLDDLARPRLLAEMPQLRFR